MTTRISITTSPELQAKAAALLSQYLTEELDCPHAYIGGFAWSLLGSHRPTEDIDVLVETNNLEVSQLRERLENVDHRFATVGIKWYFVHNPVENLKGEDLVHASSNNILIEMLKTGTLGLPAVAEPIYTIKHPSGVSFAILSPPILLLTKMKRWWTTHESTRPKTITKNRSDKNDLDFLIFWLSSNKMKIDFDLYKGKEKPELLKTVRAYRDKFRDNVELMKALQEVLHEEDWDAIQVAPETSTSRHAQ